MIYEGNANTTASSFNATETEIVFYILTRLHLTCAVLLFCYEMRFAVIALHLFYVDANTHEFLVWE